MILRSGFSTPQKYTKISETITSVFRRNSRLAARLVIDWLYKLKDLRFYPTRAVLLIPRPLAEEQIMMFLPRFG